jgi:hypothetical protein
MDKIRILRKLKKTVYNMTKNKMVQSGTRSHQEKKKELAGNEKE